MERVADYVISRLVENQIGHVFLITGRGILYLTDAVAKNKDIEAVCTYHEQGASYAAMAYAVAKDGMGACLVSTGCAATNAVTACLCAFQDNLPVIFISGQNMRNETTRYTGLPIRTYGSQEADIISIVDPISKYAVMLTEAEKIKYELDKAIYLANEGRKGPVWIDIPLDIQNARIEPERLVGWNPEEGEKNISPDDVQYVVDMFGQANRPLLFLGGGVRSAGAIEYVRQFVEKNNLPVVFSTSAADAYGSAHDLSIGAVGSLGGSRAGNFAVQNSDFILVLGSKMCSQTTGVPGQFAREARIVVVDIDEYEHTKKGIHIDKLIHTDIKIFLDKLLKEEIRQPETDWIKKCLYWKDVFSIKKEKFVEEELENNRMDLYYFSSVLSELLPQDATVITDAGFEELIVPSTICYGDTQRCLFPASQGAMGYALPAILGAHCAGRKQIVSIVGDGSFMMNMQELLTISSNCIPAKIFVINNNMYAVIRKRQTDLFRTRTIGNDPSDGVAAPDFCKIAESFGIRYESISEAENLQHGIRKVLEMDMPCICEVQCVTDQKYFHTSFVINENRKLVKRPLEDLSPFIDRDLFAREMIVKPIAE